MALTNFDDNDENDCEVVNGFDDCNISNIPSFSFDGRKFVTKILDVYDGDTVTIAIRVDNCNFKVNCRLNGIDCEEMKSSDQMEKLRAKEARQHLIFLLTGRQIDIHSTRQQIRDFFSSAKCMIAVSCGKFDKYGRVLITMWKENCCINDEMVKKRFAVAYDGKTKRKCDEDNNEKNRDVGDGDGDGDGDCDGSGDKKKWREIRVEKKVQCD